MYCVKCGKQNPDDASWCMACGNAVERPVSAPSQPEPSASQNAPQSYNQQQNRTFAAPKSEKPKKPLITRAWFWIISSIFFLGIIGAIGSGSVSSFLGIFAIAGLFVSISVLAVHSSTKSIKKFAPFAIGAFGLLFIVAIATSPKSPDEPVKEVIAGADETKATPVLTATPSPTQEATPTPVSTQTITSTPIQEVTPDATSSESVLAKAGDVIVTDDFSVTLEALGSIESDNQFIKPKEGNEFFQLILVIHNKSDEEYNISSILMFDAYLDDFAIDETMGAMIADDSLSSINGTLAPGKKLRGQLAYELAKDWGKLEIDIDLTAFKWFKNDGKMKIVIENE